MTSAPPSDPVEELFGPANRISLTLATVAALVATALGAWQIGISTVLGAAIFLWSLRQQARAFRQSLDQQLASPADPADPQRMASPPMMPRIFLVLLALAGILWYTPARPEGIVLGVGCVVIGLMIAALRQQR